MAFSARWSQYGAVLVVLTGAARAEAQVPIAPGSDAPFPSGPTTAPDQTLQLAPAPPPPSASPAPQASPVGAGPDVVYLNDGSALRGTIVKQELGKFVVIQTSDGGEQTLEWSQVKRVSKGPRSRALAAPLPPPTIGPAGVPAVRDSNGAAVTFTLAPPPKFVIDFGIGGFATYASEFGVTAVGGGLEVSGNGLFGVAPFPDTHGGDWHAIVAQAYLQPNGGGVFGNGQGGGYFALNGGVGAGYTYMHLRDIDLDYNQRGIGFMATYRLGGENFWYAGQAVQSGSAGGLAHGPWLAVIFPGYAAHRGNLSYGYIDFNIIFNTVYGQGLTQFAVGGGGVF